MSNKHNVIVINETSKGSAHGGIPITEFEIDQDELRLAVAEAEQSLALAKKTGLPNQVKIWELVLETLKRFDRLEKLFAVKTNAYPYFWMVDPSAIKELTDKTVGIKIEKKTVKFEPLNITDYPFGLSDQFLEHYPTIERCSLRVEAWLPKKPGFNWIPIVARIRNLCFIVDEINYDNPTTFEKAVREQFRQIEPMLCMYFTAQSMSRED